MAFVFNLLNTESFGQNTVVYNIPIYKNMSNLFELDVKINDNTSPSRFLFDSGASMVSISKEFYNYLIANGFLSDSDFLRKEQTILADGTLIDVFVVNIKKIQIGNYEATNVESIVTSDNAPLLIGQNLIQKFSSFKFDNQNKQLVLTVNLSDKLTLKNIKFIPLSNSAILEINSLISKFKGNNRFNITEFITEKKIPTNPKTLNRIVSKLTIRYFDTQTLSLSNTLKSYLATSGYSRDDITIENMLPYYSMSIPEYVEIWIK
jgi:hypothetical protein